MLSVHTANKARFCRSENGRGCSPTVLWGNQSMSTEEADGNSSDGDESTCPGCGRVFDTKQGRLTHQSVCDDADAPWQDEQTLRRLRLEEERTLDEIAEELGCSHTAVKRWVDRYGIEQPKPWQNEDTLRRLYIEEQLPMGEIGDRLGCTHTTIRNWLKEYGISRRDMETNLELGIVRRDKEHSPTWDGGKETGSCEWCGAEFQYNPSKDRRFCSLRCAGKNYSAYVRGPDHPHWTGGSATRDAVVKSIGVTSWSVIKEQARNDDKNTCQLCGESRFPAEQALDVHHIISVMYGGCNAGELLMSLCRSCHRKSEKYIKSLPEVEPVLVDWPDDELPEGRERWMSDDTPTVGQSELTGFAD